MLINLWYANKHANGVLIIANFAKIDYGEAMNHS